jgi:hypothetical protein
LSANRLARSVSPYDAVSPGTVAVLRRSLRDGLQITWFIEGSGRPTVRRQMTYSKVAGGILSQDCPCVQWIPLICLGNMYMKEKSESGSCLRGTVPMTGTIKSLLLSFSLIAMFGASTSAQTINAASCSSSDVMAALNSVTTDGTTVVIPSCPSGVSWTSTQSYTANNSIVIQGQGSTTGSDSLGNPTGYNDQSVFIDNASPNQMLKITTVSGKTFRMSGITFEGGSGSQGFNGTVSVSGLSQSVRVDHCHFSNLNDLSIEFTGWEYGVADHNLFNLLGGTANNGVRVEDAAWNNGINGDQSWADGPHFGSNQAMYVENNTFDYPNGPGAGYSDDADNGSHIVFRYNTMNNVYFQVHDQTQDNRGPRAFEFYKNISTYTGTAGDSAEAMAVRDGTGLIWGNQVSGFNGLFVMWNDRALANVSYPASPTGWGYCGTEYNSKGPSIWDGNAGPPTASGYPCIDQVGRGKGDLLTGVFPNKLDSVTGTIAWPNQEIEPVYEWLDTNNTGPLASSEVPDVIAQNRDYYVYTSSFTGATGTGSGLLSARPSTCTAGPGGNTNGVAYWATDTNTLYVCNPTNTWTTYYTPFTYPHPLTVGSGTPPAAPTNLSATVQ